MGENLRPIFTENLESLDLKSSSTLGDIKYGLLNEKCGIIHISILYVIAGKG